MADDGIVKDSSIWRDPYSFGKANSTDARMRVGVVRSLEFNKVRGDMTYIVEVQDQGDKLFIPCRQLRRFGGVFNFEDVTLQNYKFDVKKDGIGAYDTKAGDVVVVGFLNGDAREGVIIGGLTHSARVSKLKPADGPQYSSSFNGVEKFINKDGEYKVTFRGQPTNLAKLKESPTQKLPEPKYDDEVGTSYYQWDKTGSFTVTDNAKQDPQSIKIDKKNGKIIVTSGKIVLTMDKKKELTSLVTKELDIKATEKMTTTTKEWKTVASTFATIKSPKIAFGTDGTELLDQIIKLIDAIGRLTPITPVGPTAPVQSSPQWSGVDAVKQAINSIKGTL